MTTKYTYGVDSRFLYAGDVLRITQVVGGRMSFVPDRTPNSPATSWAQTTFDKMLADESVFLLADLTSTSTVTGQPLAPSHWPHGQRVAGAKAPSAQEAGTHFVDSLAQRNELPMYVGMKVHLRNTGVTHELRRKSDGQGFADYLAWEVVTEPKKPTPAASSRPLSPGEKLVLNATRLLAGTYYAPLVATLQQIEAHDTDYPVRNPLVLKAVAQAQLLGLPAGFRIDPAQPEWPVAYIELVSGQVSWHLPQHKYAYDGHTTAEKYSRIAQLADFTYLTPLAATLREATHAPA